MKAFIIDISHHNGTYTYQGNVDGVIGRVCNGTTEDREYVNNLPEIQKAPVNGAYIYYRTNPYEHPPEEQADLFLTLAKDADFYGVDYEVSDYDDNVINTYTAIDLYGFGLYLLQETGKRILLYLNVYNWRDVLLPLQGEDTEYGVIDWSIFDIWLPRYRAPWDRITEISGIPVPIEVDIHQYTSSGDGPEYGVESTRIDLNEYDGTLEEMKEWLGITKPECDCQDILTKTNINTIGVAELAKRLANIDSQLKFVWNHVENVEEDLVPRVEKLEGEIDGINLAIDDMKDHDLFAGAERARIEDRIDGLAGGHNHPKFFKWLGWIK